MLLPPEEQALGVSLRGLIKNAREFFNSYSKIIADKICNANGKINEMWRGAASEGTRGVITMIMGALALPLATVSVVAPIAALLIKIGLDQYCRLYVSQKRKPEG